MATRQGPNGSSQDEKRCNSCTNSTRSLSQQQARCLKSSLRDYPKRSHSTLPFLPFFIHSLIIKSSQYLDKLARSFVSHYLGYDTPPSFPKKKTKANLATCSLSTLPYLCTLMPIFLVLPFFFLGNHQMTHSTIEAADQVAQPSLPSKR